MRLEHLRVQGLRCLADVELALASGINVFVGPNGAGKTSILEAVFLLSRARSFRTTARDALLQRGAVQLSIFAQLRALSAGPRKLGLGREGARWQARVDGVGVNVAQLVRQCAVVCFEPGSHALIAGPAEERRRYLDWGVFHVEHDFLAHWQRYQRALKQRNSLLRASPSSSDALFVPWEREMSQAAHTIDAQRQAYLESLRPRLVESAGGLLPELGILDLRYKRGWPDDKDLAQQLQEQRGRDISRGHTSFGAHRADWSLGFEHAPLREHLSRGQEKLTALACVLAQARHHADVAGEWPIVCLDDLSSELDQEHQAAVVRQLMTADAQVLITGTELPQALQTQPSCVFHVEQGSVTRLL